MTADQREPVDKYLTRIWGKDIQPGREARILADDTALAADIAGRLAEEPLPEGVAAPITHALPSNLAPVKYIIHVWTHKCSLCNTEHKHSEVFALNHIRTGYKGIDNVTRPGSTWVRNMTPVARLEWQVPVDVIPVTTRVTAGCFECLDAIRDMILPTLPKPPKPDAILKGTAGAGASAGVAASTNATSLGTKTPKRPTTTDDFLV